MMKVKGQIAANAMSRTGTLECSVALAGALRPAGNSAVRHDPSDIQQARIQPDVRGSRPLVSLLPTDPRDSGAAIVLVTTDPPLKAAPKELLPLGVALLIQYDLPLQKVGCLKGGDGGGF